MSPASPVSGSPALEPPGSSLLPVSPVSPEPGPEPGSAGVVVPLPPSPGFVLPALSFEPPALLEPPEFPGAWPLSFEGVDACSDGVAAESGASAVASVAVPAGAEGSASCGRSSWAFLLAFAAACVCARFATSA
jgi:hypothetical protein